MKIIVEPRGTAEEGLRVSETNYDTLTNCKVVRSVYMVIIVVNNGFQCPVTLVRDLPVPRPVCPLCKGGD